MLYKTQIVNLAEKPMNDRLAFETTVLPNGITIYNKPWDVPFVHVELCIPIGHMHNMGDFLPGSAHFLEHMVCERSLLFPESGSFNRYVSLKGGTFNAGTSLAWTMYSLEIPADSFSEVFSAFIEHVFSPCINDSDVAHEVGIIRSERLKKSQWYPGKSKLDHHCRLKWKHDYSATLRQVLGEDDDLVQMRAQDLQSLHDTYCDPRMHVFVGGSHDLTIVEGALAPLTTRPHDLAVAYDPMCWEHREYHEVHCTESGRYLYHLGGFLSNRDPLAFVGVNIIGNMLTNTTQGVLHDWLRRDLGWAYDMGFSMNRISPPDVCDWELWLPLGSIAQAQHVRAELHDRIQKAIADPACVSHERDRLLAQRAFWYQTIGSVMDEGVSMLHTFGTIFTEKQTVAILRQCTDTAVLQKIYEEYWSPNVSGEFLALPDDAV